MDIAQNMIGSTGENKTNTVETFWSNVKLDIKQYPTFDGELAHWLKFKRNVLALTATHGLMDIFDKTFIIPTGKGADREVYEAKNQFVYSIWSSRVFGSYPLGLIRQYENTKDGKGVYTAFMDYYESTDNLERAAVLAFDWMTNLQFNQNTHGGFPAFVMELRQIILDLEDAQLPMNGIFQKIIQSF